MTLSEKVPDTITEWVAGAVCISETAGLGIAESASLTSFQPFFASYTLPYSVKRGETLVLKVSVRNYNQHELPVRVRSRPLVVQPAAGGGGAHGHVPSHLYESVILGPCLCLLLISFMLPCAVHLPCGPVLCRW